MVIERKKKNDGQRPASHRASGRDGLPPSGSPTPSARGRSKNSTASSPASWSRGARYASSKNDIQTYGNNLRSQDTRHDHPQVDPLKQKVFDNSFAAFNTLKETLLEMASRWTTSWTASSFDRRVARIPRPRQVRGPVAGGQRHPDLPDAHRRLRIRGRHPSGRIPYVARPTARTPYCGLVIYNFLSDSFRKFNRNADEGYLIGRIFINRERRYFVEGKQQTSSMGRPDFGCGELDRDALIADLSRRSFRRRRFRS